MTYIKEVLFSEIETPRCRLRHFRSGDVNKVFEGLSHPEVIKYYGVSYTSVEHTHEQMQWFNNLEMEESGKWWAIENKENKLFCGAIGFNSWNKNTATAEIGIWLLPDFWNKGLMTECLQHLLVWIKEHLPIKTLEAFVEEENSASVHVLTKCGFTLKPKFNQMEIKNGKQIQVLCLHYLM
jgi:ribosomal-protein-alanine N-acetyltransferase